MQLNSTDELIKRANRTIKRAGSRQPERIAEELDITHRCILYQW